MLPGVLKSTQFKGRDISNTNLDFWHCRKNWKVWLHWAHGISHMAFIVRVSSWLSFLKRTCTVPQFTRARDWWTGRKGSVYQSSDWSYLAPRPCLFWDTVQKHQSKGKWKDLACLSSWCHYSLPLKKGGKRTHKTFKVYCQLKIRKEVIRGKKILLCNIKGHKITQWCNRRKNSSSVF